MVMVGYEPSYDPVKRKFMNLRKRCPGKVLLEIKDCIGKYLEIEKKPIVELLGKFITSTEERLDFLGSYLVESNATAGHNHFRELQRNMTLASDLRRDLVLSQHRRKDLLKAVIKILPDTYGWREEPLRGLRHAREDEHIGMIMNQLI